jgi:hypothetical protein
MYSTLDVAYNDNSNELDKMAREINNKKNNLFKNIENEYDKKQKQWENDIIEYNNSYKNPYGYFNSHPTSDGSETNNSDTNNSDTNNSEINGDEISSESSSNLINSFDSISIDSPSIDSYIDNIKEKRDKTVPFHNFLKKLSHNKKKSNPDDIFSHIKYCFECREQLLKFMKKHERNRVDKITIQSKNNESLFSYFGTIQTKEIFLILILGIILIIFLDFLMKTPYSIR